MTQTQGIILCIITAIVVGAICGIVNSKINR